MQAFVRELRKVSVGLVGRRGLAPDSGFSSALPLSLEYTLAWRELAIPTLAEVPSQGGLLVLSPSLTCLVSAASSSPHPCSQAEFGASELGTSGVYLLSLAP